MIYYYLLKKYLYGMHAVYEEAPLHKAFAYSQSPKFLREA